VQSRICWLSQGGQCAISEHRPSFALMQVKGNDLKSMGYDQSRTNMGYA
jgi:hypothetical protein